MALAPIAVVALSRASWSASRTASRTDPSRVPYDFTSVGQCRNPRG